MPETNNEQSFQSFTQKVFTTIFGIMLVAGVGWAFSTQTEIAVLKENKTAVLMTLQEIKVELAKINSRLDADARAVIRERETQRDMQTSQGKR